MTYHLVDTCAAVPLFLPETSAAPEENPAQDAKAAAIARKLARRQEVSAARRGRMRLIQATRSRTPLSDSEESAMEVDEGADEVTTIQSHSGPSKQGTRRPRSQTDGGQTFRFDF
jgi:hypothetical protein